MCTAISMTGRAHLFGRTLDLEKSLGEEVVITPKGQSFDSFKTKYGIVGTAIVKNGIPLYFDGMNDKGLCIAALNFPSYAFYSKTKTGKHDLPSYAIIPYILGNCANAEEAYRELSRINVTDAPFSEDMPPSPLHWLIADKSLALCAEPKKEGLILHPNPFRVLTNSPDFEYHSARVCDFMGLRAEPPTNRLCKSADLTPYSRGLGAMGLPGDHSSSSRFARALFNLENTDKGENAVSAFFHIMDTVSVPSGTVIAENGHPVRTVYTCCFHTDSLTYYLSTYECRQLHAFPLTDNYTHITRFPHPKTESIKQI